MGEQPDLVVDDRGRGVAGEGRPEEVQLRERRGVERARGDALDAERTQAPAHLARRLRGEGHRHDPSGRVRPGIDAVRDAVRDHAGLSGAGTREHHDGPAQRGDRLALPFVEAVECAVAHAALAYQSLMRLCAIDAGPGRQQIALTGERRADLARVEPAHREDLLAVRSAAASSAAVARNPSMSERGYGQACDPR